MSQSIETPAPRGYTGYTLGSKLGVPSGGPAQIARKLVLDAIHAAVGAKVVLLRAPAGFGKTMAMRQHHQALVEAGVDTAWLTLDRSDNDVPRFLFALEAAVNTLFQDDGGGGARLPGSRHGAAETALGLIARIAAATGPFGLFLDDLENIHEPAVLALLRELIDHLPAGGRLILGSRNLPNLHLGRLRVRAQFLEIDAGHLRFTLEETTDFIGGRRGIALSRGDMLRLHAKSEGWIAALWLASMALERTEARGSFIERFSGTDQSISDYLAEEVLARQKPEVREFLLRTSILRQFDASLCRLLVPELDSSRILDEMARTDLLLIPLGGVPGTFRYHSLFSHFLQAQLARESPEKPRQLHANAARFYEELGRPVPAVDHALAGEDWNHALELVERHVVSLLSQGRMQLLTRWFAALPESAVTAHPTLQVAHMWATCFSRGPWEAMEMLTNSGLDSSSDGAVTAHVRALRPTALAMMDRYEEAYVEGKAGLAALPTETAFADNVLVNTMATIVTVVGDELEARELIEKARRGQGASASAFNRMYSDADDGILDLREGRLRQAAARFRIAVSATHDGRDGHTRGNAFAGVPYAAAVYEAGDLERAGHLMQVYLPLVRDIALPDHVILGYVVMSRIAFFQGDVDQALELLSEFEHLGHRRKLPRVVSSAKLERARVLLLQGHQRAAREEMDRADDPAVWERVRRLRYLGNELDCMDFARMRWDIHAGKARAALVRIQHARTAAQRSARLLRIMKLQLLEALALHRLGENEAACSTMVELLQRTCPEGFVRLVLDEGEAAAPLLRDADARLREDGHGDPILCAYVTGLVGAFGPAVVGASVDAATQLAVPLTRKEIRLLQLLADGYSNGAMAEKLFVSYSTVRTHLRNINAKLDARSRTQAIAAARKLGLIR